MMIVETLTSMSVFLMSCEAMSVQPSLWAATGMLASLYHVLLALWAYVAAGVACCTLVVVTIPTDLPTTQICLRLHVQ